MTYMYPLSTTSILILRMILQNLPLYTRVDGGYRGKDFTHWVIDAYRWLWSVVTRHEEQKGFVVLPKRWLVERTFGWFNWCRRLSKDYEILPQTSEAFIYVAMIRLMLKQLA